MFTVLHILYHFHTAGSIAWICEVIITELAGQPKGWPHECWDGLYICVLSVCRRNHPRHPHWPPGRKSKEVLSFFCRLSNLTFSMRSAIGTRKLCIPVSCTFSCLHSTVAFTQNVMTDRQKDICHLSTSCSILNHTVKDLECFNYLKNLWSLGSFI